MREKSRMTTFMSISLLILSFVGIVFIIWRVSMTSKGRGRPRGTKKQNPVLLDYRTWIIEYDGSAWPSTNYILRKKETNRVAYCDSLENALKSLEKGKDKTAINQMNAFINECEAQSGKKLTEEQAETLIAAAEVIISTIEEG